MGLLKHGIQREKDDGSMISVFNIRLQHDTTEEIWTAIAYRENGGRPQFLAAVNGGEFKWMLASVFNYCDFFVTGAQVVD